MSDDYTILQLTDLRITGLLPAAWPHTVFARSTAIGADLTGDLADQPIEARRAEVEPLRDLCARDGVDVISGNHENIFGCCAWMAH